MEQVGDPRTTGTTCSSQAAESAVKAEVAKEIFASEAAAQKVVIDVAEAGDAARRAAMGTGSAGGGASSLKDGADDQIIFEAAPQIATQEFAVRHCQKLDLLMEKCHGQLHDMLPESTPAPSH